MNSAHEWLLCMSASTIHMALHQNLHFVSLVSKEKWMLGGCSTSRIHESTVVPNMSPPDDNR